MINIKKSTISKGKNKNFLSEIESFFPKKSDSAIQAITRAIKAMKFIGRIPTLKTKHNASVKTSEKLVSFRVQGCVSSWDFAGRQMAQGWLQHAVPSLERGQDRLAEGHGACVAQGWQVHRRQLREGGGLAKMPCGRRQRRGQERHED